MSISKGQKRHDTRAFNGRREFALMLTARMRATAWKNFRVIGNKFLQKIGVFVIDNFKTLDTKITCLLGF